MKEISKIKLNQLSKAELEAKQMNALKGGSGCACWGCGCAAAQQAGFEKTDDQTETDIS